MFQAARGALSCRGNKARLRSMSGQTSKLLEAFEALSVEDKRVFTAEFLRRAVPYDSGPLEEEEIAQAADQLFAMFDAEGNDASSR